MCPHSHPEGQHAWPLGNSGKNTQEGTFYFIPHLSRMSQNLDPNDNTLEMFLALLWVESIPSLDEKQKRDIWEPLRIKPTLSETHINKKATAKGKGVLITIKRFSSNQCPRKRKVIKGLRRKKLPITKYHSLYEKDDLELTYQFQD